MNINVDNINKRLTSKFGTNLTGLPFFRIIWSDSLQERRIGVFQEHLGKVFLREFRGLRECPKYSYIKARWIVERWLPPALAYDPAIPDTVNGSYEPIYVFQDVQGNALEVNEDFAIRMIDNVLHPPLAGHKQSLDRTAEQVALEKEIELNRLELEDAGRSWIGHRLHSKEAIIIP